MINISYSKNKIYTKKIKDKTKPLSADMLSIQEMIKLYIVKVLHKRQCWKSDGLRFLQTVHHCSSSYVGTTWNKTHDVLLLQTYAKLSLQPFNKNGLRSITQHLIKWLKKYMNFVMQENSSSAKLAEVTNKKMVIFYVSKLI